PPINAPVPAEPAMAPMAAPVPAPNKPPERPRSPGVVPHPATARLKTMTGTKAKVCARISAPPESGRKLGEEIRLQWVGKKASMRRHLCRPGSTGRHELLSEYARCGKYQPRRGPQIERAIQLKLAAVTFHQGLDQRQAEARAFRVARERRR